ncbi:MAG: hypothetical protein OHK0022_07170 [Roseiflexaceae bacterium]
MTFHLTQLSSDCGFIAPAYPSCLHSSHQVNALSCDMGDGSFGMDMQFITILCKSGKSIILIEVSFLLKEIWI